MVHTCVSTWIVFVITLSSTTTAVYGRYIRGAYEVVPTWLADEQDWSRDYLVWDWSAVIIPFQQAAAALQNGRDLVRTCSRIPVHYDETSYDTCRGTNAWPLIGSKFAKNSWKLDKVDKTRCTWPFQAKNRYDVRLANRRVPGVWFVPLVLECTWYLFLVPKRPEIYQVPVFSKKLPTKKKGWRQKGWLAHY